MYNCVYEYDYDGDFSHWQKELDAAGVDYDVTNLSGCTYREIDDTVKALIYHKKMQNGGNGSR